MDNMKEINIEGLVTALNNAKPGDKIKLKDHEMSPLDELNHTYKMRKKELLYIVQREWHNDKTFDCGDEILLATTDESFAKKCYNAWLDTLKNEGHPESWETEETENSFQCYKSGSYLANHDALYLRVEELVR